MINSILPVMLVKVRDHLCDERRFPVSSIMSILQSAYSASPTQSLISPGDKFANVDPTQYQGTWTGKDYKNQPVTISITKISGYRANVTLQTSAGLQYQRALITTKGTFQNRQFRFHLTGNGRAKSIRL